MIFKYFFQPRLNINNLFLDNKKQIAVCIKDYNKFKTQMKMDLDSYRKHLYTLGSNASFMFL
jgi:hypothetical protein